MSAPVALYIHVPFCLSVCPYCDFVVYRGREARGPTNRIAATVDALATEIRLRAPDRPVEPLRSVYLGGGTPSLLTADQVAWLLSTLEACFGVAPDAEITLECNPGAGDRGDLRGFRAAGVNRLSIGAQSLDATELRSLGRRHSPADVTDTVAEARAAGFDNVSLDLLYDVPGQTVDSWRATLQAALALEPEHISAYALTLDEPDGTDHVPVTRGARRWRERSRQAQDQDRAADCYALADDTLAAAGYAWYEISNWSRPGRESRHNLAYWTGEEWEAVGPGAHAFDGDRTRRWNAARLDAYLAALADSELPPGGEDVAARETASAERAVLALRTRRGLTASQTDHPAFSTALAWGREYGLLEQADGGGARLTRRGRLLSNELYLRLMPETSSRAA